MKRCNLTSTDVVEGDTKDCNPNSRRILLLNVSLEVDSKKLEDQKAYDSDKRQDCFRKNEAEKLEEEYEKDLKKERDCWYRVDNKNTTIIVLALRESNEYSEERIRAIWITVLAGAIGLVVIFIIFKILTLMRNRKSSQPAIIHDIRNETGPGPTNPSHTQGGAEGPVYI